MAIRAEEYIYMKHCIIVITFVGYARLGTFRYTPL